MTKEEFKTWIVYNTNRKYVNPYEEWVYRKALSIAREYAFDEEKADTFVKMIRHGFALDLYFFVGR